MCLQSCQNAAESDETPTNGSKQKQNTAEYHEMKPLLKTEDHEADRTENILPDSVESQT